MVNNFFKRSIKIFLVLLFISTNLNAYFHTILDEENLNVFYSFEKGNYKIHLKDSKYISYEKSEGFSFYLPYFVKDFRIEILRVNSKGEINGTLSKSPGINITTLIKPSLDNLDYFITNESNNKNQLKYLLNGTNIYYDNRTSLVFEGYNINSNKYLNRKYFFTFDKTKDSKELSNLVCSFYMILDKKLVDEYVKKNLKIEEYENVEFNNLYTFLNNLSKKPKGIKSTKDEVINKKPSENKKVKSLEKNKKNVLIRPKIFLNLKKVTFMKEFKLKKILIENINNDFSVEKNEIKLKLEQLNRKFQNIDSDLIVQAYDNKDNKNIENLRALKFKIDNLNRAIENLDFTKSRYEYTLNYDIYNKVYEDVIYYKNEIKNLILAVNEKDTRNENISKKINSSLITKNIDEIIKEIELKKIDRDNLFSKCFNKIEDFKEECLKYDWYLEQHVNNKIENKNLATKEFNLKYLNAKLLNNIAVYYFHELVDVEEADFYLNNALKKAEDKETKDLILFNKGILLSFINTSASNQEAIKIFKNLDFKEAYYNLGINYYMGSGAKEDDKLAFFYFKKANEKNFAFAKENYDKMLKLGFK